MKKQQIVSKMKKYWQYYILLLPCLLFFLVFAYGPMYGAQIAFRDFRARGGIWGSDWVGPKHFIRFFEGYYWKDIIWNTLRISLYSLIAGFPIPIILALILNEVQNTKIKKFVQTITYAPHFISTVVFCGMLSLFLNPDYGLAGKVYELLNMEADNLLWRPSAFDHIYVWSGVWQGAGWGSVIYFAALSGVDPTLLEAATVDGATRFQKIRFIYLPSLLPTIIIQLILTSGGILSVGFEKIFLLQNDFNISVSQVISTYVYRVGLVGGEYSFSTAVGLMNSLVNMVILILVNSFARRVGETSLW